ncbi:MAG: hypothetical protein RLN88_12325, partial [Ekhidna sp.]
ASAILDAFNLAGAATGLEGQGSSLSSALSSGSSALFANSQSEQPRAYLQYLFFDENYNFVEAGSSFREVTDISLDKFAKYESGKLTYSQAGYLFVYLVNETNVDQDVFFDDLKITHSSATASFKVSQVNDFYPFGLPTSNSWRSPGYIDPGLLYQSSYASYDSLTGYYDFLSRSYDPVLGRFFAVDPAGQFSSPYAGMGNVPHFGTDPDGEWFFAALLMASKIYGIASTSFNVAKGFQEGGLDGGLSAIAGAGIGMLTGHIGGEIISGLNIGGAIPGAFAGAGVQGTLSGVVTAASGGDFWDGFKGGAISGAIQGGIHGYETAGPVRDNWTGKVDWEAVKQNTQARNQAISEWAAANSIRGEVEGVNLLGDDWGLSSGPNEFAPLSVGYSDETVRNGAIRSLNSVDEHFACNEMACNIGAYRHFENVTGSRELNGYLANDMIDYMIKSPNFDITSSIDVANYARSQGYFVLGGKKAAGHGHVVSFVSAGKGWESIVLDTGKNTHWINALSKTRWNRSGVKFFIYNKR